LEVQQDAVQIVRIFLNELGLTSFLKTSGGKGLHVVVPIRRLRDWDTVKDFSHAIVEHLVKVMPPRFVAKSGQSNRVGRIFVDYLRNGLGATTASAWSVRARPGLGVSVPLAWEELETLTSTKSATISIRFPGLRPATVPPRRRFLYRSLRRVG
jgi:bifunctional non-homologous end joining protein LigD